MFDKTTIKILKFIAKNQPCTFKDIGNFIGEDASRSLHINLIDKQHLIYSSGRTSDGNHLISLTPDGESAIEEYQRISRSEFRSLIAVIIAFCALLKPSNIDLIEFIKKLAQLLIE